MKDCCARGRITIRGKDHCRFCGDRIGAYVPSQAIGQPLLAPAQESKFVPLPVLPRDFPTHDNTMLSAFNTCPRLYEILYVRRKRPIKNTPALDWGSLFHLMLSTWYDHMVNGKEPANVALMAALEVGMKADFENYADDFRTRERALMMMAEYAEYYGYMEKRWGWKIIFAEVGFDVVGPHFSYGGKIDLLVEWQDKLWIADHKTTSRFGDDYFTKYVPDTQTAGYVWAGEKLHGRPIEGVFMNVIVVHKVKKPPETQFQRRAFPYPRFYLEEWEHQVLHGLDEIRRAKEMNYFRPRWQSCVGVYGKCAAFHLCRSEGQNREKILAQNWQDYTWDWKKVEVPLKKERDDGPILLMD